MKRYISILAGWVVFISLLGCEKELMDYEGSASIYFDVQRGDERVDPATWARWYYTPLNFTKVREDAVEVDLKVAFSGDVQDYDRSFQVEVVTDSTSAVEGVHFDLEHDWIMPRGAASTPVKLVVYKDEEYLKNPKRIMLRLVANKYFDVNMDFERLPGRLDLTADEKLYQADARVHNVILEYRVERPKAWDGYDYPNGSSVNPYPYEGGTYGAYSDKKYLLMLEVTGLPEESFQSTPKVMQQTISETMSKYLEDMFEAGTPVLEDDGRLMWFGKVTKWNSYQYEW